MSDLKPTVFGLNISMPILATIAVALRLHARKISKVHFGVDDYLAVGALFFSICFAVDSILAIYLGNLGGHAQLNPDNTVKDFNQIVVFQKLVLAAQLLSIPANGLAKLSVLFFYRRIFRGPQFNRILNIVIAIVVAWLVGFILANFLYCLPFPKYWDGKTGDCVNTVALYAAITVTDVLTDIIILSLPIPQIWKLQLPTSRKIQIAFIFLLGSFVIFTGIARTVLPITGIATRVQDYSYNLAPTDYWTITEVCVGVISACLPTLGPIFIHHGRGSSSGSRYLQKLKWSSWTSLRTSPSQV